VLASLRDWGGGPACRGIQRCEMATGRMTVAAVYVSLIAVTALSLPRSTIAVLGRLPYSPWQPPDSTV
jgi:hypothetical protein